MRIGRGIAALLVGALLGIPAARAEDDGGDERVFLQGIERLYEDCKRENFDSGLRKLKTLLKKHEGRMYARARRAELEDLAVRLSFGAEHEALEPKDVVSGRIEKFDPRTGYLKIRYTQRTAQDFERERGGLLVFPARVKGPFLFEVTGSAYPGDAQHAPQVLVGGGVDESTGRTQLWQVVYGSPEGTAGTRVSWLPARLVHRDGDRSTELDTKEKVSVTAGRKFRIQLKMTESRITAGLNASTILSGSKTSPAFGQIAFDVLGWSNVFFAGVVEPSFIQGRIDAAVSAQLAAFYKSYDRSRLLPAWLFDGEATSTSRRPSRRPSRALEVPVEVDRRQQSVVRRVRSALKRGDWFRAYRSVEELVASGAPPATTAWLYATVHSEAGDLAGALESVEECLAETPEFLDAQLLKGRTLQRLGRTDDACATYEVAMAQHAQDPEAYVAAALAMLFAGRPEEARRVTEKAIVEGATSEMLARIARVVVKARRGPTWNRTFEYVSRNFLILSDIDKPSCIEASKLLEEALISYRVNLHWVPRDKTQLYTVYLFGGRSGFRYFMAELEGLIGNLPEGVAGLYHPLLKQLVIWNLPDREEMLETIRHEGFHQYLDRWMPEAPIWFNEGLAVYHQNAERRRSQLHFGAAHEDFVRLLLDKGLVPLEDFLYWSREKFYSLSMGSYAQAWALMHMLREGKAEHRALFKALVADLQTEPTLDVIRKHFPADALPDLQRDLEAHLRSLR